MCSALLALRSLLRVPGKHQWSVGGRSSFCGGYRSGSATTGLLARQGVDGVPHRVLGVIPRIRFVGPILLDRGGHC